MKAIKYPSPSNMSCQAVAQVSQTVSWSDLAQGSWEWYEAIRCEKCDKIYISQSGDYSQDTHCDADENSECNGTLEVSEGPMMNYFYPLDENASRFDCEDAARKIADLPLCIIVKDDEIGLALTGGGMDLRWDICEAYMRLGMLPPVDLVELPEMGRGASPKDAWIVAGCMRSLSVVEGWMASRRQRLRQTVAAGKKRAAERRTG